VDVLAESLFMDLFACQHNNFWTIKCRMMKLGG